MKKILFAITLMFTISALAQEEIKEGVIIASQIMSSENEQVNAQLEMMGKIESKTYFKGGKSRGEVKNPMSGDVTTITDPSKLKILLLMDNPMMGKKFSLQSIKEEDVNKIVIKKGKESKMILGYKCDQYFLTSNQNGANLNIEMFVTEKVNGSSQFTVMSGNKIKGTPLTMVMKMNQMGTEILIKTEVTEIKKEAVSDDKFDMTPPEGYTDMKM